MLDLDIHPKLRIFSLLNTNKKIVHSLIMRKRLLDVLKNDS